MKKPLIIALLIALIGVPVFATDTLVSSSNITLSASVDYTLTLSSTIPSPSTLDPTETSKSLGNIVISSNLNGYTLTITSANGGKMMYGTNAYPYKLNVGSVTAINLATAYSLAPTGTQPVTTLAVSATYATASSLSLPAGVYQDTLTVSLYSH
ncbi:MAG: hypothetical protein NT061_09360 [Spirochaetes bacterium]|nr:hypothetical protein [Spirochaetota bacterium]